MSCSLVFKPSRLFCTYVIYTCSSVLAFHFLFYVTARIAYIHAGLQVYVEMVRQSVYSRVSAS